MKILSILTIVSVLTCIPGLARADQSWPFNSIPQRTEEPTGIDTLKDAVAPSPQPSSPLDALNGNSKSSSPLDALNGKSGNGIGNVIEKPLGGIVGEGTTNVLTGKVSPEVAIAGDRLGIPARYLPEVQKLYDSYKSTGSITESSVSDSAGLSSWLRSTNTSPTDFIGQLGGVFGQ